MPLALAEILIGITAGYLGVGLLFAIPFALRWCGRLDPAAMAGSPGFRLLIIPGAVLLWPLLGFRLLTGSAR